MWFSLYLPMQNIVCICAAGQPPQKTNGTELFAFIRTATTEAVTHVEMTLSQLDQFRMHAFLQKSHCIACADRGHTTARCCSV